MELSPHEAERLAALVNYGILDTGSEETFDRVTRIAAAMIQTPIALVSLVDWRRQWFKSVQGLDSRETTRDVSFCTHAVIQKALLVVPDATLDERFRANPLVTGKPHIRFYAGAPLITPDGFALGTVCAIDTKPREGLTHDQARVLQDLAGIVVDLMEARKASRMKRLAS